MKDDTEKRIELMSSIISLQVKLEEMLKEELKIRNEELWVLLGVTFMFFCSMIFFMFLYLFK